MPFLLENPFLQMALWACLLSSIPSGIVGSFVVIKRISFIAGSISHSVLGGMGFFLWLQRVCHISWCDPLLGAFLSALGSAWLLGWIHLRHRQREDALIAALWSSGMAIGVIFLSLTPGTNVELLNYLLGNILFISPSDLLWLTLLSGSILMLVFFFYRRFLSICFDEEQALLQGIKVERLYLLLLSVTALSVVLLMQMIGLILVLAFLTLPSTIASLFTHRLIPMMALSIGCCAFFSVAGLCLSSSWNLPPGATIALLSGLSYLFLLYLRKKKLSLKTLSPFRKIETH